MKLGSLLILDVRIIYQLLVHRDDIEYSDKPITRDNRESVSFFVR